MAAIAAFFIFVLLIGIHAPDVMLCLAHKIQGKLIGIVTEELVEQSTASHIPFHARFRSGEIARALVEIDDALNLPIEDYA